MWTHITFWENKVCVVLYFCKVAMCRHGIWLLHYLFLMKLNGDCSWQHQQVTTCYQLKFVSTEMVQLIGTTVKVKLLLFICCHLVIIESHDIFEIFESLESIAAYQYSWEYWMFNPNWHIYLLPEIHYLDEVSMSLCAHRFTQNDTRG